MHRIYARTMDRITITLSENELDELIECVANAADRAESVAYNMTGTPKARALAQESAKRLYALATKLENKQIDNHGERVA